MDTPIYDFLKEYAKKNITPFHMPGHKMGRGLPFEFCSGLSTFDITEISGADYLHQPAGIIKKAQELAAEVFGSERTFFLVNGSTCGIYSIIHTICKPGDRLIVARDCHKSVINGMMLAGVTPIYILPEYNSEFGISSYISAEKVAKALDENSNAAGVLITRPNYYGICSDLQGIAKAVHSRGKILAVDEAHGAHLRFSSLLPVCAMDAGADICVQSAHKTLPALTQGAYIHVKSDSIDLERLVRNLEIFQTTSPSYIIMASLDIARQILQKNGRQHLDEVIDIINQNKSNFINKSIRFLEALACDGYKTDTTRITANISNLGITGYKAEEYLRENCNIQIEMSDLFNIVCITTIADNDESLNRLFSGLLKLMNSNIKTVKNVYDNNIDWCGINNINQKMEFNEIMQAKTFAVKLTDAVGRTSRDIIAPYPPGMSVVCPGEIISQEAMDYLINIINAGGKVNGIDENLNINVI